LVAVCLFLLLMGRGDPVFSQEACLKQVFNRYCLGGDMPTLLRQQPSPLHQQTEGELSAAIYYEGREQVYVMAFRGRIYKIVRRYRPATHLRFQDLENVLTDKYGSSEDQSRYPHYVDSRSGRVAAIRRGEGQARKVWIPDSAWLVELSWTREMGIALSYVARKLDQQRAALAEQGL
jgi:hypothetical protein